MPVEVVVVVALVVVVAVVVVAVVIVVVVVVVVVVSVVVVVVVVVVVFVVIVVVGVAAVAKTSGLRSRSEADSSTQQRMPIAGQGRGEVGKPRVVATGRLPQKASAETPETELPKPSTLNQKNAPSTKGRCISIKTGGPNTKVTPGAVDVF